MGDSVNILTRCGSVWTHAASSTTSIIQDVVSREATSHRKRAAVEEGDADIPEGLNQYAILYRLGRGLQGDVLLAMDATSNKLRAIKAVPRPRVNGRPRVRRRGPQRVCAGPWHACIEHWCFAVSRVYGTARARGSDALQRRGS
jgi:hypothetical protein